MFYFIPVSGVVDTVLDRDTFVNTQIASIETQIIFLPEISYLNIYIIYKLLLFPPRRFTNFLKLQNHII